MAILTCYPGLEITVEVDGQRAEEYDAPADEVEASAKEIDFHSVPEMRRQGLPYTIKYIESKPGKPFAFQFDLTEFFFHRPDSQKHQVEYECILDGNSSGYHPLLGGSKKSRSSYHTGNENSGYKLHKFQFANLEIVAGGDEKQVDRAREYGTLLIKLWHTIHLGPHVLEPVCDDPVHIESVSEKALKGRSVDNKVHFTSEAISGQLAGGSFEWEDDDKRPFAIFEFRYRTMEGLMCEGIVPRPIKNEDDFEDEHQHLDRIKPEPEITRGIKREPADPTPFHFPICYKLRRLEDGKVEIDLTDD